MTKWRILKCLSAFLLLSGSAFAQSNTKQSKNIKVPVRVAILPGFSTQGKNDIHTTSNFSLNILGGVTGSINGLEVGSLFNINKKNMHGVQSAGLFNMTGGSANGLQM